MAGVVRRDGLREAVENAMAYADQVGDTGISLGKLHRILDETLTCHCGGPLAYGFDGDETHHRGMCADCDAVRCDVDPSACPVLDAVPDVPPDPPAAEVEKLARILNQHRLIINYGDSMCRCGEPLVKSPNDSASHVWQAHHAHVAAVISGVLVDAADVRAREAEARVQRVEELAETWQTLVDAMPDTAQRPRASLRARLSALRAALSGGDAT